MDIKECVRARIIAYIHPNVAETDEQKTALENAVEIQMEYESSLAGDTIPGNVSSFSIGNFSATMAERNTGAYTRSTLSPAAWAILFNAKLLRRSLPVATRL